MRTQLILALLMMVGLMLSAGAQNTPSPLEPLLQAGQLLEKNKALEVAEQKDATLTQKAQALNSQDVQAALRKARLWLNQPSTFAPNALTSNNPLDLHINEISALRTAVNVLQIEQYVLLSEGRTSAAIDSARDGLRIADAVKPVHLAGWLAASRMETLAVDTLFHHFAQMSLTDCRQLLQLAQDWSNAPDATAAMLAHEHQFQKTAIREFSPDGPPPAPDPDKDPAKMTDADIAGEMLPPELHHLSKAEWQAMLAHADALVNQIYAPYEANLKLPLWDQLRAIETRNAPSLPTEADRHADVLFGHIRTFLDNTFQKRAQQMALAHALGVNAAIYAYRWEHNRLPDSLAVLNLGDLERDPFTGLSLNYTVMGSRYTLESVGPRKRDENGNPVPNVRAPVSLGPKEPAFPIPVAPADKQPGS